MRVLIDTSAYSADGRGNAAIKTALQEADEIYLNPIVLGELSIGFLKGRRKENEEDLKRFLSISRVKTIAIDVETAEHYAVIASDLRRAGTPLPTNDIWIAASAMQHGLTVLTTDKHFQKIHQIIVRYYP